MIYRHYPSLRRKNDDDKTIADEADFFEDLPYFDPDEDDENIYNNKESMELLYSDEEEIDTSDNDASSQINDNGEVEEEHLMVARKTKSRPDKLQLPAVPKTIQEALRGPDRERWIEAIYAELDQLCARGTFEYAGGYWTWSKIEDDSVS